MSWDWFNTAAATASLMGLILGVILGTVRRLQHRETTQILVDMDRRTKALLARMETTAEARARDRKDRLGGEAEA
jgi:hypothetical protein